MQKIMFNDKYGLQRAAIVGTKTMTRRVITGVLPIIQELRVLDNVCEYKAPYTMKWYKCNSIHQPKYQVGEVVAIAQSYKDVLEEMIKAKGGYGEEENDFYELYKDTPGWINKMFVKADFMPNHIRITDIKVERLQDISDGDCMKEGIFQWGDPFHEDRIEDFGFFGATKHYKTAISAFADLIDKVSGRGTWKRNPWVFAYTFEVIKKGGEK